MNKKLDKALSKLCTKIEYGHLMASIDPTNFIYAVIDRISWLENELAKKSQKKNMGEPIDQWIEDNGFKKFKEDVFIHIECTTSSTPDEIDAATRCIMISFRQVMQERDKQKLNQAQHLDTR